MKKDFWPMKFSYKVKPPFLSFSLCSTTGCLFSPEDLWASESPATPPSLPPSSETCSLITAAPWCFRFSTWPSPWEGRSKGIYFGSCGYLIYRDNKICSSFHPIQPVKIVSPNGAKKLEIRAQIIEIILTQGRSHRLLSFFFAEQPQKEAPQEKNK